MVPCDGVAVIDWVNMIHNGRISGPDTASRSYHSIRMGAYAVPPEHARIRRVRGVTAGLRSVGEVSVEQTEPSEIEGAAHLDARHVGRCRVDEIGL